MRSNAGLLLRSIVPAFGIVEGPILHQIAWVVAVRPSIHPSVRRSVCLSLRLYAPVHLYVFVAQFVGGVSSRKDLTVGLAHKRGGKGGMYQLIIGNKGNLQVDLEKIQVRTKRDRYGRLPVNGYTLEHRSETAKL